MEIWLLIAVQQALRDALRVLGDLHNGKTVDPKVINATGSQIFQISAYYEGALKDAGIQLPEENEESMEDQGNRSPMEEHTLPLEQENLARALLRLSGNAFALNRKVKSGYITLDSQIGQNPANKNAVRVYANRVSFMVPDSVLEGEAQAEGIECVYKSEDGILQFPGLSAQSVDLHEPFFSKMLAIARDTSISKQV